MDREAILNLSEKIFEVVKDEDHETILSALLDQIVFRMSVVCPNCRKNIARELKRAIPGMVAEATRVAVEYEDLPASCH
jgi:hypothetical protein